MAEIKTFDTRLGARVRELRKKSELTQGKLAKPLEINRVAVGQMEKGERKICVEEAVKLSEIFRIQIDAMLDPGKDVEVILEEAERKPDKPQIKTYKT